MVRNVVLLGIVYSFAFAAKKRPGELSPPKRGQR
jgi:hypothetical protein